MSEITSVLSATSLLLWGYTSVVFWNYLLAFIVFRGRCTLCIAWYDLWVGIFIDEKNQKVYVFLLPCIGMVYQRKKA